MISRAKEDLERLDEGKWIQKLDKFSQRQLKLLLADKFSQNRQRQMLRDLNNVKLKTRQGLQLQLADGREFVTLSLPIYHEPSLTAAYAELVYVISQEKHVASST